MSVSRGLLLLVGVVVGAAAGAGSAYVALHPRVEALEEQLIETERQVRDANRLARAEHDRNRILEEEVEVLRRTVTQPTPVAAPGEGRPHSPEPVAPEDWAMDDVRMEIQMIATLRGRMIGSPRVERLARGVDAQGEAGRTLLLQILDSNLSVNLKMAAALVASEVGEERVLDAVLALYGQSTELPQRRAFLRTLAQLPGERSVPVLLAAWSPEEDARVRRPAIHGLALRGHPTAVAVVRGGAPGSTPALRAQAIESLHEHVRNAGYESADLLPAFLDALASADGDAQRRLALIALEGYWSPDAVPALEAFADEEQAADALRARAADLARRIAAGEARPEDAGTPTAEDLQQAGGRRRPGAGDR